jgi:hypothetical protein
VSNSDQAEIDKLNTLLKMFDLTPSIERSSDPPGFTIVYVERWSSGKWDQFQHYEEDLWSMERCVHRLIAREQSL